MRSVTIASDELKQKEEKREYIISGKPHQLDLLEEFLKMIEYCGNIGASRVLELFVDGDGSARLNIKRKDKKKLQEHPDMKDILDKEPVKMRGID